MNKYVFYVFGVIYIGFAIYMRVIIVETIIWVKRII